ncbi:MAG: imidazole glycerol phosphate synthase subunit HisH [Puniceicoccales bacterium]|jgi:glutamine amidotransferase|nr:imidazole glycerol phosphate synthase subunit HisH [Puniceicoccales bacterium]
MIGIIDYNLGNIKSVLNACERVGIEAKLNKNIDDVDAIILPGVGSFSTAMRNLGELADKIKNFDKPILGICLGMQILFEKGYEDEEYFGLGLLKGEVKKIPTNKKLPHMGWNTLSKTQKDVYFVHSYMADFNEETIEYTEYGGVKIPAIVGHGNILGYQFHPEKSGKVGEEILKRWAKCI